MSMRLLRNVGLAVGGLGSGIAYATLFSATHGRLDLISWAFACFVILLITCSMFEPIRRSIPTATLGNVHPRQLHSILVATISSGLMIAAVVLLSLSVALSDFNAPPVPGSQSAILAAGYVPLGWLVLRLALFAWDFFPRFAESCFSGKETPERGR